MAAVAVCPPSVAVTFAEPGAIAVTNPALLTVATAEFEEAHVALEVTSLVDRSLKVAFACNCRVALIFSEADEGVTPTAVMVGGGGVVVPPPEFPPVPVPVELPLPPLPVPPQLENIATERAREATVKLRNNDIN